MLASAGEAGWRPPQAAAAKRVAVVGAGLASLEVAWIAASRGHAVAIFSAGGRRAARLESRLPGRAEVAGAAFRPGEKATADSVRACVPDEVVLAAGSAMCRPLALAAGAEAVELLARRFAHVVLLAPAPRSPASST